MRNDVGDKASVVVLIGLSDDHTFFNVRVLTQYGVNLLRFYADAANLDLIIHTANKLDGSVSAASPEIPGLIQAIARH
jgi:hypothetical protein